MFGGVGGTGGFCGGGSGVFGGVGGTGGGDGAGFSDEAPQLLGGTEQTGLGIRFDAIVWLSLDGKRMEWKGRSLRVNDLEIGLGVELRTTN